MKKYVPTMHSKVRFSQRIGSRCEMNDTVRLALRYGVRLDDVDNIYENRKVRKFLKRNKIYYKGRIYIFAGQNQYKILVTVYNKSIRILDGIFEKKEHARKRKYYHQMYTTQKGNLYSIIFYKDRVVELSPAYNKSYSYEVLTDKFLKKNTSRHLTKLLRGKESPFTLKIYFGCFTELEEKIYKTILDIPFGDTITYKEMALKFEITVQKLTRIINNCPVPILIPTHRVKKSNGQVGSYTLSKEIKKNLLFLEKKALRENKSKKRNVPTPIKDENEYFSYSIGDLLKL